MPIPVPSIFNDILGPVMTGPSSSHTCAPVRIGYLAGQLVGSRPRAVRVVFKRNGSFTHSYKGQRSDVGFLGGALGYREFDPALPDAYGEARRRGVQVRFDIEEGTPAKPNLIAMHLVGEDGETVVVQADSTGGGTLVLFDIDGFPVDIRGESHVLLVRTAAGAEAGLEELLRREWPVNEGLVFSRNGDRVQAVLHLRQAPDPAFLARCRETAGVIAVHALLPVHPVLANHTATLPPVTAEELLATAGTASLGDLGRHYEMARSGWSPAEVDAHMDRVTVVMENAARAGMAGQARRHGIHTPMARALAESAAVLDLGILNDAVPWAMGIMEMNSDMGLVVGGPTGGSAGVVPGAVLATAGRIGASPEARRRAMFAAGMAGVILAANGCTYSAELSGCQVEVGAASALAAAGLVDLLGGTAKQACDAAATAIHNSLGLICDPVAGLVELPCISRNAMGVANAAVCARMVLAGYDPVIGLDETVGVMIAVGDDLPSKLRCTGQGGLCDCPTGRRLHREQAERDAVR